ncbi:hypothetical protein APS67_000303 [Streptomyces sp. AVP053U2]|nr:hypothetical protein APS67_000303 [Streptomyces sp. AVP053U2]
MPCAADRRQGDVIGSCGVGPVSGPGRPGTRGDALIQHGLVPVGPIHRKQRGGGGVVSGRLGAGVRPRLGLGGARRGALVPAGCGRQAVAVRAAGLSGPAFRLLSETGAGRVMDSTWRCGSGQQANSRRASWRAARRSRRIRRRQKPCSRAEVRSVVQRWVPQAPCRVPRRAIAGRGPRARSDEEPAAEDYGVRAGSGTGGTWAGTRSGCCGPGASGAVGVTGVTGANSQPVDGRVSGRTR